MEETFSFLTANTEEQEEFLQRIKDMSGYENSQALTVESVFQFMPLTETISVNSSSTSPLDQHDDEASNSSISSSSSSTHSEAPTSFSQISPQTVPLVSAYNSINNSRQWKLIHLSPLLASRITNSGASVLSVQQILDDMHIEIRTRSEKAATAMPERLYSSLKYEFKQKLSHNFSESQVLMAKIQVVNPQEPTEEMLKTNGQTLLKGLSDMTVLSRTGLGYESKSKVQFTDVSYHFENKHFAIKITYFDPSYNIEEPIMILMSSPFKVFARRPSSSKKEKKQTPIEKKKVVTTNTAIDMKKRKLNETIQETNKKQRIISATTPAPLVQSIELKKAATMKDFLECLELLAAFKKTLTKDEQKVALQLAKQKLFTSQEEAITMQ